MKNENQPKFLLCVRYDARIALENRRLGAFEEHYTKCSNCAAKCFVSKASVELLRSDKDVKPICQVCADHDARRIDLPAQTRNSPE